MLHIGFFRLNYYSSHLVPHRSRVWLSTPQSTPSRRPAGTSGVFIIISTWATENGLLMVSYNGVCIFHLKYLTSLSLLNIAQSTFIHNLPPDQDWSWCKIYPPFSRARQQLGSWAGFGNNFFLFKVPWESELQSYFSTWKDGHWVKIYYFSTEKIYIRLDEINSSYTMLPQH